MSATLSESQLQSFFKACMLGFDMLRFMGHVPGGTKKPYVVAICCIYIKFRYLYIGRLIYTLAPAQAAAEETSPANVPPPWPVVEESYSRVACLASILYPGGVSVCFRSCVISAIPVQMSWMPQGLSNGTGHLCVGQRNPGLRSKSSMLLEGHNSRVTAKYGSDEQVGEIFKQTVSLPFKGERRYG
ncbi:hypothetical protein llap_5436 [Limosa lapponica baueri]|uniref:Uncharacterized protein n=1 Tax=Limosa lapponica baueri TaxID=1758121 RepID=A0A2I0UDY6_LIMLA|nr:hypothetical protein llap_5436 [Limosa lapponica baueri]